VSVNYSEAKCIYVLKIQVPDVG